MSGLAWMLWLIISALLVGLDQATKIYANAELVLHRPVPIMPNFNLTLAYNPGAAFSFLSDAGGWQRWFFTALSTVVSVALVIWLKRMPGGQRTLPTAVVLILSGAIGNLVDRVLYGYVIDFIQVYYSADSCLIGFYELGGKCYWPSFNIADSVISIGACLLIVQSFFPVHEAERHPDRNAVG